LIKYSKQAAYLGKWWGILRKLFIVKYSTQAAYLGMCNIHARYYGFK